MKIELIQAEHIYTRGKIQRTVVDIIPPGHIIHDTDGEIIISRTPYVEFEPASPNGVSCISLASFAKWAQREVEL